MPEPTNCEPGRPDPGSVSVWIPGLRAGEEEAVNRIWERFFAPLVRVTAGRMSPARCRSRGPEDVVTDVILKFLRLVTGPESEDAFPRLSTRGNLWAVLQLMASRAAYDHNAKEDRRASLVGGESAAGPAGLDGRASAEPVGFSAGVAELLDLLDDPSDPKRGEALRTIARMRMEGYGLADIAARLGCTTDAVERKLRLIRRKLDAHRPGPGGGSDAPE